MSRNTQITPTSKEYRLSPDALIVTKTDLKGCITYANESFLSISMLEEQQTLAKPHNIIRHPDMPKAVFRLLWDTLKKGNEFFGIIKNISMDGSFYWVFANVTPSFDDKGKMIGYFSVCRQPSQALVKIMSKLYQQMVPAEKRQGDEQHAIDASMKILNDFIDEQGVSYNEYIISFV
ncbi:MAG: PAS domain-containing protein [Colwellia sp.]|nr:PAS domain-containing protein [Colwellia sp.]